MFGWEFPPLSSGGLGTACYGLTKGLKNQGIDITFVLPCVPSGMKSDVVKLVSPEKRIRFVKVNSLLTAYSTVQSYHEQFHRFQTNSIFTLYGKDLFAEVHRFALSAADIALDEDFDIIHCHDWMTFLAGIRAKECTGKPLIVHVHATEFDRTGGNVNQGVYDIERQGLHAADGIIAVSYFTKNKIIEHYGISPDKIRVVHNAIDPEAGQHDYHVSKSDKVVLFLGRMTLQKGPDYFLAAAKKCLDIDPSIRFVMAGTGDLEPTIIERAASMGIADKVLFAGFLTGTDVDRMYSMADLYVMPSVSEPFGITSLEAMKNGTPAIISKQSGVSEVIHHCLKVDFWDVNDLADKILSVLRYEELHQELKKHGSMEVGKFSWNEPARKCCEYYGELLC